MSFFFPSLLFLLQNLDYTHNTHFHIENLFSMLVIVGVRARIICWAIGLSKDNKMFEEIASK